MGFKLYFYFSPLQTFDPKRKTSEVKVLRNEYDNQRPHHRSQSKPTENARPHTQQEFHLSLKPHPRINAPAANSKTQCKNSKVGQRPQSCSKKVMTCSLEKDTNQHSQAG